MKQIIIIALIAFSFQSCAKKKLKLNDIYSNKKIEISLIEIGDSRCPNGAMCFWEGNAFAKMNVKNKNGENAIITLNTYSPYLQDTTIFGHKIELKSVLPYPDLDKKNSIEDYKIKLAVTKQ